MRSTRDHGRALRSATAYFVLVFLVGFVLGVLALHGLTLREYFATRDPVSGTVCVAMLVVFAAMPSLLGRRQ